MGFLDTALDHRAEPFRTARVEMLGALARLESALDAAREGGGERAVTRHHARGKLLARERIELLVDRDSPLLELSPVAGWGIGAPVGAAVVTAIGVVEEQPCVVIAQDPTVLPGMSDGDDAPVPGFTMKVKRAQQIARQNRLPLVWLAEDAGYGRNSRDAGALTAGFARVVAAGVPTTAVYFGVAPAERTGPFDYTIALRTPGLAGNPDQDPGAGAPATHLADDERDALRLARQCARRPRRARQSPPPTAAAPKHDLEDLLAVPPGDPWEILARLLDGSEFDEVDETGGDCPVCAGWGDVYGHPVAVLADRPPGGDDDSQAAVRLVRLAARSGTPLLYLAQGAPRPGPLAGAVAEAGVPLVTVRVGSGPGDASLASLARFRFGWPDTGSDAALAASGRLEDDGVIDPRDTRTVLGFCLSVIRP